MIPIQDDPKLCIHVDTIWNGTVPSYVQCTQDRGAGARQGWLCDMHSDLVSKWFRRRTEGLPRDSHEETVATILAVEHRAIKAGTKENRGLLYSPTQLVVLHTGAIS